MKQKIIISVVFVALLLLTVAFVAEASGITNFTSVTLSGDLVVGDDATIADDLTVTGATTIGETLEVTGATTLTGGITGAMTSSTDITATADVTGGNAGAKSEISGLFRMGATPTNSVWSNGTTETVSWMDATPTGEWAEVDAGTNLALTKSTTYWRVGAESLKVAFTDVVENDGIDATAPAQDDWSAVDSFGFWIYSDVALTSGDFDLTVDDSNGTDQVYTIGAVVADIWTWIEIDISGCDSNCDTVDGVFILVTSQGETNLGGSALNMYLDSAYKWDVGDEEAISAAILDHGVLFVLALVDANTGVHNQVLLVEHTDYFVHYESGNDFVVAVSDQSANSATVYYAY